MRDDDVSLPPLPKWNSTEPISPSRPKKRVRLSSPIHSSDPAIFSSDDDPSIDNYTNERQKKQYRGPWYQQEEALDHSIPVAQDHNVLKKSKRTFERQYDSGVFLGSDSTDMDENIDGLEDVSLAAATLPIRLTQNSISSKPPPTEASARQQIDHCVENGIELIDLSSQGISTLSNDTIRPLVAFTCMPSFFDGVISRFQYSRFEPKIQVFLASNNLSNLPEELFNLSNLAVLSLRANQLRELPPSVGRLRNIMELNISQNGLQYLPYEILDLFSEQSRLEKFQMHPNPFQEPRFPPEVTEKPARLEREFKLGSGNHPRLARRRAIAHFRQSWHCHWRVRYRARTEVRFLTTNGSHWQGPTLFNNTSSGPQKFSNGIPIAADDYVPIPPKSSSISRAPSLLEVALRGCSKTIELPHLDKILPHNHPAHFPALLARAVAKKESGGSRCTICRRSFIIPRTEWLEWWEIARNVELSIATAATPLGQLENSRGAVEKMVPLIRRGCSWLCMPKKLAVVEEPMVAD